MRERRRRRASVPAIVQAAKTNGIATASERPKTATSTSERERRARSPRRAAGRSRRRGRGRAGSPAARSRSAGAPAVAAERAPELRPCAASRAAGRVPSRSSPQRIPPPARSVARVRRSGRRARSEPRAAVGRPGARRGSEVRATSKTTTKAPSARSPKLPARIAEARAESVPGTANESARSGCRLLGGPAPGDERHEPEQEDEGSVAEDDAGPTLGHVRSLPRSNP